jgi:hypothetical protein
MVKMSLAQPRHDPRYCSRLDAAIVPKVRPTFVIPSHQPVLPLLLVFRR